MARRAVRCATTWSGRGVMQPAYEIPQVSKTATLASELDADLLAVPILQDQRPSAAWLERATGGELAAAYERGEFGGKPSDVWIGESAQSRTRRVIAVGAGPA